jgi:hypothetical protein
MHAFSILTIGIFVAGYSTARWDLVTRVYELAIFAWDHGVVTRTAKGFALLSLLFFLFILPIVRIATQETDLVSMAHDNTCNAFIDYIIQHPRLAGTGISAREQLKRRGSF